MRGAPVLLLTTTGRKSGKARTAPVLYLRDGNDFITVASNGGKDSPPSWWRNLQNHSEAWIQVKKEKIRVTARKANSEEKARLWPMVVKMYSGYAGYQKRTKRVIPVVILTPS